MMNKRLFPYAWNLSDGYPATGIAKNNYKVFGTFICGGGSTMGYKLAGFDHLGGVEIDGKVAAVYARNHSPRYLYNEDIRVFNARNDLPDELYNLDLSDGSPPCSSFSLAGNREADWTKEKVFREGQAMQTLDDLVFVYCDTIIKLKPKVFLLENVKGIISGNAQSYSKKIVEKMEAAGYVVQVFLMNGATMGVPQLRERVFFIGHRKELKFPRLKLAFNEKPILFSEIIDRQNTTCDLTKYQKELWDKRTKKDKAFGAIIMRTENRLSMFSNPIIHSNCVSPTITSSAGVNALWDIPRGLTRGEYCKVGTFPGDYEFLNVPANWLIGMSVPPVMTAQISNQIRLQWLDKQ